MLKLPFPPRIGITSMKSIYLFFFSLILLAGCNETQPPLQEAAEAEAPVAEQTAEAEAPVAEQTTEATSLPIIEFVWHKKGPDFTEEAFTDAIAHDTVADIAEHTGRHHGRNSKLRRATSREHLYILIEMK